MQVELNDQPVYLDGLIVECILCNLRARDLATVSSVCRALQLPAAAAAHKQVLDLVARMECTLLRHCERGSWISQLKAWEAARAAVRMWLCAADPDHLVLTERDGDMVVKRAIDRSGRSNFATMHRNPPKFNPRAVNGLGAMEFAGGEVLKTLPFAQPLQQPITLVVVARARGDTTMVDSLTPVRRRPPAQICARRAILRNSAQFCAWIERWVLGRPLTADLSRRRSGRFELCHGYPSGWHPSPEVCMTASGQDSAPRNSLRGSTRGTGEWHIYTAIYDERKSEMYVDGYCEANGKSVGSNKLDGLSIGCDHNGVFFLSGAIAELRLLHCHIPTAQRVQMEAALARRYGLSYSCAPTLPTAPAAGPRLFSCARARGGGGAAAAAALRTAEY